MALPMVLWTIALLTGTALLLAGIINGWIVEETRAGKLFRARQQALSGVAVAMNPGVLPGDPLLQSKSKEGEEGYLVEIKDESGLINPNHFLSRVPDRRDLLKRLFSAWGLDMNQSDEAADGLFDWQSPAPFRSLHGAKKPEYEAAGLSGMPPGAPFVSPEEMTLVIGYGPVMKAKPDHRSFFTTCFNGPINVLRAPKSILTDFLGLTPPQADAWITLRAGKDGIEGTDDDAKPTDLANAVTLMGVSGAVRSVILESCGVAGGVRRIESTGFCNGVKHRITVICVEASSKDPQAAASMLGWSEQ
jgi:hypothetical protein